MTMQEKNLSVAKYFLQMSTYVKLASPILPPMVIGYPKKNKMEKNAQRLEGI